MAFLIGPIVLAPISTDYEGDYIVYSTATTQSYVWSSSRHGIYQIDDYLYVWGGYDTGSLSKGRRWYSSDNGGVSWAVASTWKWVTSGVSSTMEAYMSDAYLNENNSQVHNPYCFRNSGGSGYLNYSRGLASAGWVNLAVDFGLTTNFTTGTVSVTTLSDGCPVVASVYSTWSPTEYRFAVWFGNTSTPTALSQFTQISTPVFSLIGQNGFYDVDVHAINSTAVYCTLTHIGTTYPTDLKLWGVPVTKSAIGTAAAISTYDVEGDHSFDANSYPWAACATVSDNTVNSSVVSSEIFFAYINSNQTLYAEIYNVTSASVIETQMIENFSANGNLHPKWVSAFKQYDTYFVGVQNFTSSVNGVSENYSMLFYERNYLSGNWSSAYTMRSNLQTNYNGAMRGYMLTQTPLDGEIYVLYFVKTAKDELIYHFSAYGEAPYIPSPPGFWDTFSFPFSLILGMTGVGMVFGGGLGTIHYIKQKEFKDSFNALVIALVGGALVLGWFFV